VLAEDVACKRFCKILYYRRIGGSLHSNVSPWFCVLAEDFACKRFCKILYYRRIGLHFIATSLPGFVCWPRTLLVKGSAKNLFYRRTGGLPCYQLYADGGSCVYKRKSFFLNDATSSANAQAWGETLLGKGFMGWARALLEKNFTS